MYQDPRQYTHRNIQTAGPGQLIVMLYDGMIRFFNQAKASLEAGDAPAATITINRGLAIITELRCTLDMSQGEISDRLAAIYDWCNDEIIAARMEADPGRIAAVVAMLTDLRSAWSSIASTPKPRVETNRPVLGVNLAG